MRLLAENTLEIGLLTHAFVYWDNWLTDEELFKIEQYCNGLELRPGMVGSNKGSVLSAARKSNVRMVSPNADNGWIFDKLFGISTFLNNRFYGYDLFGFESFQYTVYGEEGSKYDFHTDMFWSNKNTDEPIPRKLSFSIILSDPSEYEGGQFEFKTGSNSKTAEQKRGRILAFPSFVLHRVTPIKKGIRKSIVFWAVGPKFK